MPALHRLLLPILLLHTFLPPTPAQQTPCHPDRWKSGIGVTCEKVRLPPALCTACKLKPPGPSGNFLSCTSIYSLDAACKEQLRWYANLNRHCDPVRLAQTAAFAPADIQALDYFVYSICEECCDCIPQGALVTQYDARLLQGTLFSSSRGNCPAHAVYDICRIWPKVRFVSSGNQPDDWARPMVCPLLNQWLNSPQSAMWPSKAFVPMHPDIKAFLDRFLPVAKCSQRGTWERCQMLEAAQSRI